MAFNVNFSSINSEFDSSFASFCVSGGGGVSDYTELTNLPKLNGVTITGDNTADYYNFGTVYDKDTGTTEGTIPIIGVGGKLPSDIITETDPVFAASAAAGITSTNITTWNNKSNFSGSYTDLTNKPAITDLTGTLTVAKGGTGATTATGALSNLLIFTDVTQIGLTLPTTTKAILAAMPDNSRISVGVEATASTITDAPFAWGMINIVKVSSSRRNIEFIRSLGGDSTHYWGAYDSGTDTLTWNRVVKWNDVISVAFGGTGATTATGALTNLGAAKSTDLGTVSSLTTTSKIAVGAINELHATIGDLNEVLETILGGG